MEDHVPEYVYPPGSLSADGVDHEATYMLLDEREELIVSLLDDDHSSDDISRRLGVGLEVVWQAQDRYRLLVNRWSRSRAMIEELG